MRASNGRDYVFDSGSPEMCFDKETGEEAPLEIALELNEKRYKKWRRRYARPTGRQPLSIKDGVRAKVMKGLAREPVQPQQAKVERAILKVCGSSISESTARRWAREFLADDLLHRQRI
jgi:hypothetical protein